jgi:hypothetical protein
MNKLYKSGKKVVNFVVDNATGAVTVLGATSLATAQNAMAAVPASVTTGIADSVTDVGTVGALILGVVIVVAGFSWLRRPIH